MHRLGELRAAADRLDRHRLDHQLLGLVDEAEARFVRRLEGRVHLREASEASVRTRSPERGKAGTTSAVSVPA